MIKKILIANRGEIAVRIIKACKHMGIKTVAVYSEADKDALFVQMADESFFLGDSRVTESYLNKEKVLNIAKEAKVDAIHPGYGLLSENSTFAEQCEQSSIVFIGPKSEVIRQMGNKTAARKWMEQLGIPVVPGTTKSMKTMEEAQFHANKLGYPVMLKAASGGGGMGMMHVSSEEELASVFLNIKQRAEQLFGDGSIYIEKQIENARHIEIQVLADHFGNVIHLYDRECSIQRRNQKVLEEAPSVFLTEEVRKKMGNLAVKATRALQYTNAGTFEFLLDENQNIYFLEMNTRIQVEHPVTEEITGVDIVKEQINIANGEKLHIKQSDVTIDGHAIEVRLYAEDPTTFFPSPGKITTLNLPRGDAMRNEIGVQNGDQVTPFYDPMIGKLIVKGNNRRVAIEMLTCALEQYKIEGIKTNIPLLKKIVKNDQFIKGQTNTQFIKDNYSP